MRLIVYDICFYVYKNYKTFAVSNNDLELIMGLIFEISNGRGVLYKCLYGISRVVFICKLKLKEIFSPKENRTEDPNAEGGWKDKVESEEIPEDNKKKGEFRTVKSPNTGSRERKKNTREAF